MSVTLIIGGARSGKSRLAQEMALQRGGQVLFVATAEARDEEMRQRIAAHRRHRPPDWPTLELTAGLGQYLKEKTSGPATVIIDCITLLVSNILERHFTADFSVLEKEVDKEIGELVDYMNGSSSHFIIVTNEVGLGIVPENKISRIYRDLLGKANQMLAKNANEVIFLMAGIPVYLKKDIS